MLFSFHFFSWDAIIGTSMQTMRKLPLIFRKHWHKARKTEIESLARSFHTIIIDSQSLDEDLVKILIKMSKHVRIFELIGVFLEDHKLVTVLNSMSILSKLIICDSRLSACSRNSNIPAAKLKTLKYVLFTETSDWKILDFIQNTNIETLKLSSYAIDEGGRVSLQTFLQNQHALETLAIKVNDASIFRVFKNDENKNYQFKLKRLGICYKHYVENSEISSNFIKFLEQHKDTLEYLEIDHQVSDDAYKFIMNDLKIKKLRICGNFLPVAASFYNSMRPNLHLRKLILSERINNSFSLGLLGHYRDIELFEGNINYAQTNDAIIFMAHNLKNLKHLSINTVTNDMPELPIASLKTFHVNNAVPITQWRNFIVSNPTIETISVLFMPQNQAPNYEIFDAITTRIKNLKKIQFGPNYMPTNRVLELISRNCKKLHKIEIFQPMVENERQTLVPFVARGINIFYYDPASGEYIFSKEPEMWNNEELEYYNLDSSGEATSNFLPTEIFPYQ